MGKFCGERNSADPVLFEVVFFFLNCVLLKQPIDDSVSDNHFQLLLSPDFSYCPHHTDFPKDLDGTNLAEKIVCSLLEHTETENKFDKSFTKSQCQKKTFYCWG